MSGTSYLEDIFLKLIKIHSESKKEYLLAKFIEEELNNLGFEVWFDDAGKKIGGDTGNLLARMKPNDSKPKILLNAHMDTVFTGNEISVSEIDRVLKSTTNYPFGADDKAGIAVILNAVKRIVDFNLLHGEIVIMFTVCEEIGLLGVKNANLAELEIDFAYVLDSHGNAGHIINSAPSQISINMTFRGKSAHAGIEPEKGINSIQAVSKAVSRMHLGRLDSQTTANIGKISGGTARNIVPDFADIEAEARSHDETELNKVVDEIIDIAKKTADEYGCKLEYQKIEEYKGYRWSEDDSIVRRAVKAAESLKIESTVMPTGGGSDTNIFNASGIPAVAIGTGYENPHSDKEKAYLDEMAICSEWLINILTLND